ncbi:hypothetical protein GCM10023264_00710 [Sphingomonas daechungensis]|uniref:DUF1311 domain-containing protein n=1 Tax=Sphingomonas daechungensis TaxID=1176646 RepID=A0ABX6T1H6_9SPHN|nr:hypothetical protein [Sphingomonas daechungensis]QNP42578.1 hypothetical protein H9L15_10255 [Sphingomonas daechungensis]
MDPQGEGGGQRINATVIASVALGVLILILVGMMLWGSRSSENDRLTGDEVSASAGDPSSLCSGEATSAAIRTAIFQQAAELRGSDQAALAKIASAASVRMEAAVLRDEGTDGSVTCNGTLTLDLPPGVAAGGKSSLSADVLYTVQQGAGSDARTVTLTDASAIVGPLSSIATTAPDNTDPLSNTTINGVDVITPPDPLAPQPEAAGGPSFNCANARTAGEAAVCDDPNLAALDRRMSAQFAGALAQASPEQRELLIRTRNEFLGYRDQCTENACIADTYRGRMREIRDIMTGDWHPQR